MSEMCYVPIKSRILDILVDLENEELSAIEQWISSQKYLDDLKAKKVLQKSEKKLIKIANVIKKIVPFEAEMQTEIITPPTIGDQADCNEINTHHVDEFLYDDNEVEELAKKGKIKRRYCLKCNSQDIKDLTFISHSMSKQALQYIFKVLLPEDLNNKQLLDVGSRIGAVIFGAYYLSNCSSIVGIEINKECCEVQNTIIDQFSMDTKRIKIVQSDILERSDIVENSNIIVINVLDFFVNLEKHKEMWRFFKKHIKKGSYLICNRSMIDTLESLDLIEEFMDWLSICRANQPENELLFDFEDCHELFIYLVN